MNNTSPDYKPTIASSDMTGYYIGKRIHDSKKPTIQAVFDRISPTQVVLRFDGSEDLDEFLAAYRPKTTASDPQKTPLRGKDAPRGD